MGAKYYCDVCRKSVSGPGGLVPIEVRWRRENTIDACLDCRKPLVAELDRIWGTMRAKADGELGQYLLDHQKGDPT